MLTNPIRAAFPTLLSMLADSQLDADVANAEAWAQEGGDALWTALEEKLFSRSALMSLLTGVLDPILDDSAARTLEADLAEIIRAVGLPAARTAYRKKLLVNDWDKLEDTRYELAVAARACGLLDADSVRLEKPIPDAKKKERDWKNTDLYGTFRNQPVRIEVTVLHDVLPPTVQVELDDLVRGAEVASGFVLTLRSVLVDRGYAERVRALVELLHERHIATGGANVEIDGVSFEWRKGAYHCDQRSSPFTSVVYHSADEFAAADQIRDVIHPLSLIHI